MDSVGAYEAKTHLPKLLDRVMKGESITITKHGVPVAVLSPPVFEHKMDVKMVIAELKKLRETQSLTLLSIRELIEEGRR